jgi:ActD protein
MSGGAREFIVARFEDERRLIDAVRAVRARGLRVYDVYAPYAIHGLDEAMSLRRSRLSIATIAGGVAGLVASLAFEFYAAVIDWPLNVGGKPDNSTLAFIPIAFELTVLGAGLATVAAFLTRCRLMPAISARCADAAATDDAFVLALRCRQTAFDRCLVERLLFEHGAETVEAKVIEL